MADQADDDLYFPPPKPKWKRRLTITGIVLLVLLIGAEWYVSAMISAKLRSTVSNKLDAELHTGLVIYLPPYGALMFEPRLVRGNDVLMKASRLRLSLAGFPKKERPIVISSLRLSGPQLFLAPNSFRTISKPGGKHLEPRKLSGMLQLNDVRVHDGKVQWRDPSRPDAPPMSWEGVSLEVDTVQQSVSRYTFHVRSRAQRTADVSAAGAIDVDSLLLEVRSLTFNAQAEPDPIRSPLPQAVQEWLKKYRVNGNLTVSGNGSIPLRDFGHATFNANVTLENALAEIEKANLTINRAHAELVCTKRAGTPLNVQLKAIEVITGAGAARTLTIKKGLLTLDAVAGRWALSDVEGYIAMERAAVEVVTAMTSAPSTAPSPPPKFERFHPSGRADLSIAASGPFKITGNPWEAIDHEIVLYPRSASFIPKSFAGRIEDIGGGEVRIKGGMIILQELSGRYGNDMLRVRSARLPIDGLPEVARWQEISGSVMFDQPIRRYSPALDKIFDALNPDGTFLIAGSYTIDKTTPTTKPTRTYDLIVSSDTGSLALTSRRIPLANVRGDATITQAGVQLHGAAADLLNGKVTATGQWMRTSEEARTYDGDLTLRDVDLGRLKAVSDNPPDASVRGKLTSQATFSGITLKDQPTAEALKALRASGEMEIVEGDFFQLPVLKQIFEHLRLKQAATVGDGAAVFDVAEGVVTFRDAGVSAPVLGLQGGGKLSFEGNIEANVVAAPLADWREKLKETRIPIVSDVAGEVAGAVQKLLNSATSALLYEFRVTGNVRDKLLIETVPTPALTDTAAIVFGRMLQPRKDQRPLDWFRRDQPRANAK